MPQIDHFHFGWSEKNKFIWYCHHIEQNLSYFLSRQKKPNCTKWWSNEEPNKLSADVWLNATEILSQQNEPSIWVKCIIKQILQCITVVQQTSHYIQSANNTHKKEMLIWRPATIVVLFSITAAYSASERWCTKAKQTNKKLYKIIVMQS